MKITEVRVFSRQDQDKKLRAFATITIDACFVIRDIKIIEGSKGLFVAMPSRRVKGPCPRCRNRNIVHSQYCSQCGAQLPGNPKQADGNADETALRQSEHKDIAHPIPAECREYVQRVVLEAYEREKHKLEKRDLD